MSWLNDDGLFVTFGTEKALPAKGGSLNVLGGRKLIEFDLSWDEVVSTTPTIIGTVVGDDSPKGITLPKGAVIEQVDTVVTTAWTSSGTIGSATLVLGTKQADDRSTEADHDGLTAAAATGTVLGLATLGSVVELVQGSTGHGADIGGVALPENAVLVASNSAHATHPYTAGVVRVRIWYR
jgi:hypothetical protein